MVKSVLMKLKDYLTKHGKDCSQFAKEIGVSAQSVYRYVNGERIPDRETMPRILAATNGAVTADSFYH